MAGRSSWGRSWRGPALVRLDMLYTHMLLFTTIALAASHVRRLDQAHLPR